jgi:hypothetical protein
MDEKTAVSPARVAEAKLYHERQARKSEVKAKGKESFVLTGKKVLKKTRMPNGTVYSTYFATKEEADNAGVKYTKGE